MLINKEDLQQKYAVSDIANRLGVELIGRGGHYRGTCPVCNKWDSFYTNDAKEICGCYVIGCECKSWDIFELVMKVNGVEFPEALEWISGEKANSEKVKPKTESKPRKIYDAKELMKMMSSAWRNKTDVANYINKRGIPFSAVDKFNLGTEIHYEGGWFRTSDGEWVKRPVHKRHLIPWVTNKRINAIAARIDYESALESARAMPRQEKMKVKKHFDENNIEMTPENLVEIVVGPRYLTFGSKRNRIYNGSELVIGFDENGPIMKENIPILVMTEGEINAIGIQTVTGYPAIACKGHDKIKELLSNVGMLVLMQDNDKEIVSATGTFRPGEEYVKKMLADTGRKVGVDAVIVKTPSPHNDAADYIKAERSKFKEFLESKIMEGVSF